MAYIFEKIEKYSLSFKNIEKIINKNIFKSKLLNENSFFNKEQNSYINKKNNNNNSNNNNNNIVKKNKIINEKDKLFWMFYQFLYGYDNYVMLGPNKFSVEMKTKTKWVQTLKNNKQLLKKLKIKISELEENILYKKLNIKTLYPILVIEHINLIYFTEKLLFINKKYENKKSLCVSFIDKKYVFHEEKELDIEKLQNEKYTIVSLNKPLLAISNYKVTEIRDICNKLNICVYKDVVEKKKFIPKTILYKLIKETIYLDNSKSKN